MALEGSKIPYNAQAAALADRYVEEIRKQCGWASRRPKSKANFAPDKENPTLHFQETEREWELSEEDIAALEQIPF